MRELAAIMAPVRPARNRAKGCFAVGRVSPRVRTTETLAQIHSLLHDWSTLASQERQDALENVSGALAMFQELHLSMLALVLPAHSSLLDPVRFPFNFELPEPRRRVSKARRR